MKVRVTIEWTINLSDDLEYPESLEDGVEKYLLTKNELSIGEVFQDMTIVEIQEVMPWEKSIYM